MPEFKLTLDTEKLTQAGVSLKFDEKLYSQLLQDELQCPAPEDRKLHLKVAPWPPMLAKTVSEFKKLYRQSRRLGAYSNQGEERGTIELFVTPKIDETLDSLFHETSHWLDDVHDAYTPEFQESYKRKAGTKVALGSAAVSAAVGLPVWFGTGSVGFGAAAMLAAQLAFSPLEKRLRQAVSYTQAPWEIAAREFGADEERHRKYGSIISYQCVNKNTLFWRLHEQSLAIKGTN